MAFAHRHHESETGVPKDEALTEYGEVGRVSILITGGEHGSLFEWYIGTIAGTRQPPVGSSS